MSDTVIKIANMGKKYIIRHKGNEKYQTLRDTIANMTRNLTKGFKRLEIEEFWALRNINLEIRRSDRIGIIGRNGAGKSTLLKLLSRITEPTTGRIEIKGRIASLLEVGTGFHPELTGRENIYLNGAILGMTKAEIRKRYDEIVEFAEIENFLDTPVKRYSSGMYVRLAFAVAAHLEPEILIVDEVLAVGDGQFQKKCIEKMRSIGDDGRTVLFVSHNMAIIQNLCNRGALLKSATLAIDGDVNDVVRNYIHSEQEENAGIVNLENHRNRLRGMKKILKKVTLMSEDGEIRISFRQDEPIVIKLDYSAVKGLTLDKSAFILYSDNGFRICFFNTNMAFRSPYIFPQHGYTQFKIRSGQLAPGNYTLTFSIGADSGESVDKVEYVANFEVTPADVYGTGRILARGDGVVALKVDTKLLEFNS